MHIDIIAIGKAKRDPAHALYDIYVKRLDWRVDLTELTARSHQTDEEHTLLQQALEKKKHFKDG
jgi:23S rRNA pseudoU1915 N3-methylase RlmH